MEDFDIPSLDIEDLDLEALEGEDAQGVEDESGGALTYAIIGSLNKIPIAILGYFIFESTISKDTWFFISVSMAGGFLYSYAKLRAASKQRESSGKK